MNYFKSPDGRLFGYEDIKSERHKADFKKYKLAKVAKRDEPESASAIAMSDAEIKALELQGYKSYKEAEAKINAVIALFDILEEKSIILAEDVQKSEELEAIGIISADKKKEKAKEVKK